MSDFEMEIRPGGIPGNAQAYECLTCRTGLSVTEVTGGKMTVDVPEVCPTCGGSDFEVTEW